MFSSNRSTNPNSKTLTLTSNMQHCSFNTYPNLKLYQAKIESMEKKAELRETDLMVTHATMDTRVETRTLRPSSAPDPSPDLNYNESDW